MFLFDGIAAAEGKREVVREMDVSLQECGIILMIQQVVTRKTEPERIDFTVGPVGYIVDKNPNTAAL